MKYSFIIITFSLLLVLSASYADELDDANDSWDTNTINSIDTELIKQKPVTDDEFNKTVKELREKREKQKWGLFWFFKKDKGDVLVKPSFIQEPPTLEVDYNTLTPLQQIVKSTPTIMLPTDVITDDGAIVPTGFYKLSIEKVHDNNYNLLLLEGSNIVAKVHAYPTNTDYSPNELNYVKTVLLNDKIQLIYGSLDLNLEAYLLVKNKKR